MKLIQYTITAFAANGTSWDECSKFISNEAPILEKQLRLVVDVYNKSLQADGSKIIIQLEAD